jgi:hypothetical protein
MTNFNNNKGRKTREHKKSVMMTKRRRKKQAISKAKKTLVGIRTSDNREEYRAASALRPIRKNKKKKNNMRLFMELYMEDVGDYKPACMPGVGVSRFREEVQVQVLTDNSNSNWLSERLRGGGQYGGEYVMYD